MLYVDAYVEMEVKWHQKDLQCGWIDYWRRPKLFEGALGIERRLIGNSAGRVGFTMEFLNARIFLECIY